MNTAFLAAATQPWMITEPWLKRILEITAGHNLDPETARAIKQEREAVQAVWAERGKPVPGTRLSIARNGGVAVLPVTGPIIRYAGMFDDLSGVTSIEVLARDFRVLLEDPDIESIVLYIDSPGGTVNGIAEFSEQVFQARSVKQVKAYVSGMGTSAAYFIASAAGEIVCDSTALLGSIGTIMAAIDVTGAEAIAGIRRIPFVSSVSPYKNPDPTKPEDTRHFQAIVDPLGEVFVAAVMRNRNVPREKVLSDFGQGGLLVGQAAVEAGLCDRLGSFEALVLELAGDAGSQTTTRPAGSSARAEQQTSQVIAEASTTEAGAIDPAAPEEETDMKFSDMFAKMFGGLSEDEKKEAVAALQVEDSKAEERKTAAEQAQAASSAAPPAQSAASQPAAPASPDPEIARLKAEALAEKKKRIVAEAESFVRGEILAARLLPAESVAKKAEYVQAAMDDETSPVASGKSRVETLKDAQAARPRHVLTEELLRAAAPDGAVALGENRTADPLEQARLKAEAYAANKNARTRQFPAPGQSSQAVN